MYIKDKSKVLNYAIKLKQIWELKELLIIEGEKTRLGVGNDLFNNSKSIKRRFCPAENVFNLYDKIIGQAKKFNKSNLILLALGPTSTVLTYDLYKLGYQSIDVCHIDIEYEWFLILWSHIEHLLLILWQGHKGLRKAKIKFK